MKQFFGRLFSRLIRDDLFLRVTCALFGLLSWTVAGLLTNALLESTRFRSQILISTFAIVFAGIGGPLALRSVLSIRSRAGTFLDRHMTPTNLFAGLAMADSSLVFIFLPAILLTLFLRGLGVRGQVTDWCRPTSSQIAQPTGY